MICYLFVPIHWLFFAASTYVWVQYVWHTGMSHNSKARLYTRAVPAVPIRSINISVVAEMSVISEKGVCIPTVFLWLLFIYVEASIRLKEFKASVDIRNMPFHLDLCRPFAAHW